MYCIVQDVRACLIWHTKGPGKCIALYRRLEYSGFIVQEVGILRFYCTGCQNLSNLTHQGAREMYRTVQEVGILRFYCTGCQSLSNLTHQGTREMYCIVQDVRACLIWHTKGPGKCIALYRMSEPVYNYWVTQTSIILTNQFNLKGKLISWTFQVNLSVN